MKYHLLAAITFAIGSTAALSQEQEPRSAESEATATSAANQSNVPEAVVEPESEEPDPGEEIVCRRERVTGSLTRIRRTCMTRDEWTNLEARTRDALNETNRSASGSPRLCNDPANPAC